MNLSGLFIVAAGVFSIMGGVFDWDWFFNSTKGQLWVSLLGRNGARGFFIVLGLGLTILGALITLRVLS